MIRDTLEREAYHVIEASSGKDVETLITRHCVSAVVTDIEMPEMSGQIVLTMVKRLQPGLPVIIISSHQDFNAARQVLRDGALDYLVKPFSDEELCQAVKRAVSLYEKGVEERLHREESERRLADLVLLREVGETASGEVDIQSLLERILDFACEAVKVETASLMLAEDAGFLTIRASRGCRKRSYPGAGSLSVTLLPVMCFRPVTRFCCSIWMKMTGFSPPVMPVSTQPAQHFLSRLR